MSNQEEDKHSINDVDIDEEKQEEHPTKEINDTGSECAIIDPNNEYNKIEENPEDNDGENRNVKEEEKSSMGGTIVSIVKTMVGCGILNMPLIFKNLGLIPGSIIIILAVLAQTNSTYFIMKCKNITHKYGYSMYAKISAGALGTMLTKFFISLTGFFICCVYTKVFGSISKSIITLIFKEDNTKFYFKESFNVIVIFLIMMPLMFKEDITSLAKYSFIGVCSVFTFVFCIIILYIYKFINNELPPVTKDILYPKGTVVGLFSSSTAFLESMAYQINLFPIYFSMKNRNSPKMVKSTAISLLLAGILYYITGILGYLMYTDKLNDMLLIYFKQDVERYKAQNKYLISVLLIFCMVCFFISALLTMPLIFLACKKNLITLFQFAEGKCKKKQSEDEKEKLSDALTNKKDIVELSSWKKNTIIIVTYIAVLILALSVEKVIIISNYCGSTAINYISFIGPGFFMFKIGKGGYLEKLWAIIFLLIGIGILSGFFFFEYAKAVLGWK